MKRILISLVFVFVFAAAVPAQHWETVGSAGFSADVAVFTSIAIDGNGIPYVVYTDKAYSYKAVVMKYNKANNLNVYHTNIAFDPIIRLFSKIILNLKSLGGSHEIKI